MSNGGPPPEAFQKSIDGKEYACYESMQYTFPAGGGSTPSGSQAQWVCWLVRTNSKCGCTCGCDAVGCSSGGTPAVYYGNTGNVIGVGQLFGGTGGGGGGSCGCGGGGGGNGGGGNTFGPSPLNPTAAPSAPPPPSPYLAPPSAQGHQAQLRAVNLQLQRAAPTLAPGSRPGALEVWDGRTGNLMKQYSPPIVDDLAPWPVFTYNSMGPGSTELGSNWTMLYRQTINTPNSTTAALTNGIGLSFTYTNKNPATGVYTAPPGAPNKLVQNANGTWTETAPDGSLTNYNTGGNLATLQKSSHVWTLGYDPGGRIQYILDPVGRRSSFAFAMIGAGMRLTRYTDAVGRVTTFGYQLGTATFLKSITSPAGEIVTMTSSSPNVNTIRTWTSPLAQVTTYSYNIAFQLTAVTDTGGRITTVGYNPGAGSAGYRDPRNYVTTYLSGSPVRGIIDPQANRTSFTWSSGLMTQVQNPRTARTTVAYATLSGGQALPNKIVTPAGSHYTWSYDASNRLTALVDPYSNRTSLLYDSSGNRRAQVDPLNARTSFLYTSGGQLRATIDALGHRSTALYDSSGRVYANIDATGARTTYGYNSLSQVVTTKSLCRSPKKTPLCSDKATHYLERKSGCGQGLRCLVVDRFT